MRSLADTRRSMGYQYSNSRRSVASSSGLRLLSVGSGPARKM